jgi:hypothetical protein
MYDEQCCNCRYFCFEDNGGICECSDSDHCGEYRDEDYTACYYFDSWSD